MSIRAMNWAMDQATGCPWTQCLLYVVADCANPEGICWPSADWMAEKSQQSRATVYRRLTELRDMGLVALFPRFLDEDGKVFYEAAPGRRQTSPEIRLILSAKVDLPRKRTRRSAEENEAEDDDGLSLKETGGVSHCSDRGVATERQGLSHCSDSKKNPNLNQEDSPPPPKGGNGPETGTGSEADDGWIEFERAFTADGVPVMRHTIARPLFGSLDKAERALVTRAAKGYLAGRRGEKRPPAKASAQTFLRERDAWAGYAKLAPPDPVARVFIREGSRQLQALCVLAVILDRPPPTTAFDASQEGRGYWRPGAVPDDLAGLAAFPPCADDWMIIEPKTQQFYAWATRIHTWTGHRVEPQTIMLDELVTMRMPDGRTFDAKKRKIGLRVPCEWPPRKDGSTGPPPD